MADEHRMFIAGEWVGSESGATFEATSPSTGEVIGTLPEGTRGDVRRAVAAAAEAFGTWSRLTAFERGRVNVNEGTNYWESLLPFGGRAGSASGVGRVGGRSSIERLTELKTIVVHLG
jgi:acyl-CoA reductase-like NAD-dependent aldehyde dehydrogenase